MKKIFKLLLLVGILNIQSCANDTNIEEEIEVNEVDKEQFLADLKEIETKIEVNIPVRDDLIKAVTMFQDFAGIFPTDDLAPDYLLKASDIALILGQYEKSVKILKRIINEYSTYPKIESVYYNRASHTDFELRDTAAARVYYNEFLEKFPQSDFVDDAQTRIEQNFMSLEELVESFMQNAENEHISDK